MSIRHRLLVWLLSSVLAGGLLAAGVVFFQARSEANELFDYQLRQLALTLRDRSYSARQLAEVLQGEEALDFVIQVWASDGTPLYVSHPQLAVPTAVQLGFSDGETPDGRWRLFAIQQRGLTIEVAQPFAARDALAFAAAWRMLIPFLVALPLMGLLIWRLVGRELRFLESTAQAVARRTPGFTGADLANVLNEAALLTARTNGRIIDDKMLDEAIDRVVAGPQKRTRVMSDKDKKMTAYHEGGHALVAAALRNTDPVTKVTILPRGRALGYTMVMPLEDKYSVTRNELLDQLAYAMGGRVAEELVFHDPTSGASNDIEKATATARKMVTQFGMSATLGAVKLGQESSEVFLGRDVGHQRDYSEEVAAAIDVEVRALVETAHDEAWEVLTENRDVLDRLVLELLEKESLNAEELAGIFADVRKRPERDVWLSGEERAIGAGPVLTAAEVAKQNGTHVDAATDGRAADPARPV